MIEGLICRLYAFGGQALKHSSRGLHSQCRNDHPGPEGRARYSGQGQTEAGDQSGRSLQVGFHGLLGAVLRDVGKTAAHKVSAL